MYNQYRHMTSETLIAEALRMAALHPDEPDMDHMLRELCDRLSLVEGFRRGYFDGANPESASGRRGG